MGRNTKDEIKYFVLNTILILISIALIIFIMLVLKDSTKNINVGYEESPNIITSTMGKEQNIINTNTNVTNNEKVVLPPIYVEIDDKTNNSNASNGSQNNTTDNGKYDFNKIKNDKYYFNQLNNNAQLIYSSIDKNLNNMKTGTYEIKLPSAIENVFNYSNSDEILNADFQSAWDALFLDRVDVFFIDISKIRLSIKKITYGNDVSYELEIVPLDERGYLIDGLTDQNSVDLALTKVKQIRDEIVNNATGNDYNKVLQVHDWIIENFEYSSDFANEKVYNIYGALVEKNAVCEGYAESFKYILDEIGIPCVIVSGTATNSEGATENHAWNYVQLNGKWYGVDTTWDDPVIRGFGYVPNSVKHKYFLQGSNSMNSNHFPNGKITKNGQQFVYPELSFTSYE